MNNRNLSKISLITLFVFGFLSVLLIISCRCFSCEKQEEANVPVEILQKADAFIIKTTGKEFFNKYITADFYRTKVIPPYYEMAYRFFIPEKPYVNATIKFTVDSVGNVMKNRDIVGIPKCQFYPEECNFNIDEATAKQIAANKGLKEGVKEWDAGFLWDFKLQRYVWRILSTLKEFGTEESYKANGQEMVIDPNTGEVLALNDWHIN